MGFVRKYPRTLLAIISFILALILVSQKDILPFKEVILNSSYAGSFIAGILYVFTFTSAPSTALLLMLDKGQSLVLLSLVAGIGSLLGDLVIFKTARLGFHEEALRFTEEKSIQKLRQMIPSKARKVLGIVISFIIIASPLPDEFGVAMISNFGFINSKYFVFVSYALNTAGIFTILLLARYLF